MIETNTNRDTLSKIITLAKQTTGAQAYEWGFEVPYNNPLSDLKRFPNSLLFGFTELVMPATVRSLRLTVDNPPAGLALNNHLIRTVGSLFIDMGNASICMFPIYNGADPMYVFGIKAGLNAITHFGYNKLFNQI